MTKDLSPTQRKFAEIYASGRPAGRAYEEAGYSAKGASADSAGSKLLRNDKVSEYVESLKSSATSSTILTILERKEILTEITNGNKKVDPNASRQAIAELNKMDGGYEPERHEVEFIINIGGDAD